MDESLIEKLDLKCGLCGDAMLIIIAVQKVFLAGDCSPVLDIFVTTSA